MKLSGMDLTAEEVIDRGGIRPRRKSSLAVQMLQLVASSRAAMMVRRLQLTQHFTHRPPSGAVLSRICKDEESGTSPWPWQMPRSRQPWPSWRLPGILSAMARAVGPV